MLFSSITVLATVQRVGARTASKDVHTGAPV